MIVHPLIKKFYPEAALLGYTFVDGTAAFYNSVNRLVSKNINEKVLLDLGCGRGWFMERKNEINDFHIAQLRNYKGRVKKVIGVDVDTNAATNPTIDEFRQLQIGEAWPVEDNSIDICICDYVMEHVSDVSFFFSELNRVMKKDGVACFRTPNKFGYMAMVSALVPNSLHKKVLKKIQPDRKEADVFPVVYKCNTRKTFSKLLKENSFEPFVYYYESEPNYLRFSYLSFAFGYYLQKFLPSSLKTTILAFGIKR